MGEKEKKHITKCQAFPVELTKADREMGYTSHHHTMG